MSCKTRPANFTSGRLTARNYGCKTATGPTKLRKIHAQERPIDLDVVRTTTVAGIGDAGRGFAGITDPGYNGVRREREIKRWKSSRWAQFTRQRFSTL
jgi:hypothetical protein